MLLENFVKIKVTVKLDCLVCFSVGVSEGS